MLAQMLRRHAPPKVSLSYRTSATSTSSSITIPSGAEVGDIAVLFDFAGSSNTTIPTSVVPSGFTSASNKSSSTTAGTRAIVSYKKLVSGDPGASITGMNGGLFNTKRILIFSPSSPISTIMLGDVQETITDSAPAEQTVSSDDPPYLVIGAASTRSYTPSWTAAWYDDSFSQTRTLFAYKLFNASFDDVSIDFTAGGYSHACIQAFALIVT